MMKDFCYPYEQSCRLWVVESNVISSLKLLGNTKSNLLQPDNLCRSIFNVNFDCEFVFVMYK